MYPTIYYSYFNPYPNQIGSGNSNKYVILWCQQMLLSICHHCYEENLILLLQFTEMTALHMASQNGHIGVVRSLLEHGANIDQQDLVSTHQSINQSVNENSQCLMWAKNTIANSLSLTTKYRQYHKKMQCLKFTVFMANLLF